jgi:hypothetical protein
MSVTSFNFDSIDLNESIDSNHSNHSNHSNDSECFICNEQHSEPAMNLLDYEINRQCRCSAKLHARCYSRWLSVSKSCPVCRKPIREINPNSNRIVMNPNIPENHTIDMLPNYNHIVYHERNNNICYSILIILAMTTFLILIICIGFIFIQN